jgi:peptidoglycan/xylan/chitin deacetylase (PgdA/CDA1 family)
MSLVRLNRFLSRHTPVKAARLAGDRPIASVTFDDFPKSAWVRGGPILARYNIRATYYTAGCYCGRSVDGIVYYDAEDLRALARAGHEIACHGFGHQPTPSLTDQELEVDAARNAAFLEPFLNGGKADSYAFPYGLASPRTKRFYAPRFTNLRGVHPGSNSGRADLALLKAVSIELRCWDSEAISRAIAKARQDRAWVIFYTHDISEDPSPFGSTPGMLSKLLHRLVEAGIEILPMREAVKAVIG